MKARKGKQTLDLLALSPSERNRLCKEIRSVLQQRVQEEKYSQLEEAKTESGQFYGNRDTPESKSNITRIKESRIWKRLS